MATKYRIGEFQPARSGKILDTRIRLVSGVTKKLGNLNRAELDSLIGWDMGRIAELRKDQAVFKKHLEAMQ